MSLVRDIVHDRQLFHVEEGTSVAEVARRMAAQFPDNEKAKVADFVVDNSGTLEETERQVEQIIRELRKSA